jgi:hypothetical protein
MIGELADSAQACNAEYRNRKNRFGQRTFRKGEQEYASAEGWELVRENQNSLRFQRLKPHDEQLENEFWCLVYNLGHPCINVGQNFQIQLTSSQETVVSKQIDVFAYDSETIIIAECKSSEKRTKRPLQKRPGRICG